MRHAVLLAVSLVIGSCRSGGDQARFEQIAERANPVIKKLQPSVAIVLRPNAEAKAVRTACLQAISDAAPLETVKFEERRADEDAVDIDGVLNSFAMQRDVMCMQDKGDGTRDARCVHWCTEMFQALADGLERVKTAAAKEHVQIETLTR